MLTWLARRIVKNAWLVIATWLLLAALCAGAATTGLGGASLFDRLAVHVAMSGTESAQGEEILATLTGDKETVTLLVTGVDISTPAAQEQVATALSGTHKRLGVMVGETNVLDPFVIPGMLDQPAGRALAAKDLDGFLIIVTVDPNGRQVLMPSDAGYEAYRDQVDQTVRQVEQRLAQVPAALRHQWPQARGIVSDADLARQEISSQVRADLSHAELVTAPVTLVIMVLVFGGFLLAATPLLGAVASVATSLGVLWVMSDHTELMSFVVNIVTVIGLGLSIDYALLLTSRYREELVRLVADQGAEPADGPGRRRAHTHAPVPGHLREHRHHRTRRTRRSASRQVSAALVTTLRTAGRTILFSGATVAACMLCLALTGSAVLTSIAWAGLAVVLIAIAAALTLVPAVLVVAGTRLARPSRLHQVPLLGRMTTALSDVSRSEGFFSSLARLVQRVPWVVLTACVVLLLIAAAPLRSSHLLSSTTELLPPASSQRAYAQVLARDYPATRDRDATVIIAATGTRVASFVSGQLAEVPGVRHVSQTATAGHFTVVYLDLAGDGTTKADEQAVRSVRALNPPADMWVVGQAAAQVDLRDQVLASAPLAGGVAAVATMVLLFLMTGSVLIPLKALVTNVLSLAGAIGILTWVFQEGHGAGLLGFTPIGGIESYVVITAVAVGFGLAMDYEVFILARVKEFHDAGYSNDEAVAAGLQRSGRVVTSAAVVMVAVFLGFVGGDLLAVKQIGLAMALVVAIDATLVRVLLVPATMSLLGRWNWWAPAPLRRVYERYGITEG